MRRVKAISSAAIEENRVTAAASAAPRADLQEPVQPVIDVSNGPSSASKVGVVLLLVALVGLGAGALRRRQAQSA
jgi:MYXO-CTERM domain-containing protein